jgi:excisionase family DNA binding protein
MTMLTLREIQKELKVSIRTVYRWIRSGKLKAVKLGGVWRVSEKEFNRFIGEKGSE